METSLQVIPGITLADLVNDPNLPEEVIAVSIDALAGMARQIREVKMTLEGRMIDRMTAEKASKLPFRGVDGSDMMITLKPGKSECKDDQADVKYAALGFDPLEIGRWTFEPSWSKAKEMRKMGGEKQRIIDELFKEGKPGIKIDSVTKKA